MYKLSTARQSSPFSNYFSLAAALALATIAPSALAQDAPAPAAKTEAPVKKSTAEADSKKSEDKAEPAKADETKAETAEEKSAAPTEEEIEAARVSFEAGKTAFEAGDFATAEAEFQKANKTIPSPHAEYWIASALDKVDEKNEKTEDVVAAYSKFLSNPGAAHVGASEVADAQARLAELKKLLPASLKLVTTPAGAAVTVDGKPVEGTTPLTLELTDGPHKLELSLADHETQVIEFDAEGGSSVEQQLTFDEVEIAPEPVLVAATATPKEKSIVPAVVTLSIGGAGLIAGTVFGILALNAKSAFNDDPTESNADKAERNALIADMSFGIALTLGITGVVLLTSKDEADTAQAKKKPSTRLMVAPYGNRHGGGAAARLTF